MNAHLCHFGTILTSPPHRFIYPSRIRPCIDLFFIHSLMTHAIDWAHPYLLSVFNEHQFIAKKPIPVNILPLSVYPGHVNIKP